MTNEQRVAWRQTWALPHMQEGLQELRSGLKVSGKLELLEPGYDALVLSASTNWFAQGQQSVLNAITTIGIESPEPPKPLPVAFKATTDYLEQRR